MPDLVKMELNINVRFSDVEVDHPTKVTESLEVVAYVTKNEESHVLDQIRDLVEKYRCVDCGYPTSNPERGSPTRTA